MEEQYRKWKRNIIEERAAAYSGSPGQTIDMQTLAALERRLTYNDFKAAMMQGDDGGRLLNYVNANVIFQAGVDFESKPMVVFCACSLPSPQEVDYDRMLNLIIFRLDEFVESDYTVVMLTSGAQYNPGWGWLTKAYRRLDRRYRKNVKNVYVVHPSMWSKLIFQIFGRIVSQKFFAKVTWVDTLSQLATLVPLNQINVPQPVYEYNAKIEHALKPPSSAAPRATTAASAAANAAARTSGNMRNSYHPLDDQDSLATRVYGVPLAPLMNANGRRVLPRPVRECLSYLYHNGLSTDGLFRRSPPSTALRAAKDSYNHAQSVDLSLAGVHVAAVLLKLFYRELPEPVFSMSNYDVVRALPASMPTDISGSPDNTADIAKQMDTVRARYVEEVILPSLRPECRLLLCFTFALLHLVARNDNVNRMTSYNLAIVWSPNLARSPNPIVDANMCAPGPAAATVGSVVQIMVQMYSKVFAREIGIILGKRAEESVDIAREVMLVVDRMNSGDMSGIPLSPALPPRKSISPAIGGGAIVGKHPSGSPPGLPPRRVSAAASAAASATLNGMDDNEEVNNHDGNDKIDINDDDDDVDMFADAESASIEPVSADAEAIKHMSLEHVAEAAEGSKPTHAEEPKNTKSPEEPSTSDSQKEPQAAKIEETNNSSSKVEKATDAESKDSEVKDSESKDSKEPKEASMEGATNEEAAKKP
ncbi:hypothetical protein GGI07_002752 [Coemansia sp. Benny D115]|nr:hypothetical protein GGI07_002752 [Coemansia sp. Benny D115]